MLLHRRESLAETTTIGNRKIAFPNQNWTEKGHDEESKYHELLTTQIMLTSFRQYNLQKLNI